MRQLVLNKILFNFNMFNLGKLINIMKLIKRTFPLVLGGVLLFSCSNNTESEKKEIDKQIFDENKSLKADFEGKIFSIPSPIQMSMLLKETKVPFNKNLLNKNENSNKYINEYKQALNLGVYGADLGYASINGQNSSALNCLSVVESLTSKLGLDGIFDKSFLTRFEENKTNKDSVLVIVSEAFSNADNYLKNKNRKHTSSLILTGGWIESMYYACELNNLSKNSAIVDRICEQQQSLTSIIEILSLHNNKKENDNLIADLNNLKVDFDKITMDYEYKNPKTDAKNKITTLQHSVSYKVSDETISEIFKKILSIREKIIS